MKFRSTRAPDGAGAAPFSIAVEQGLAPDGGLYVPEAIPTFDPSTFAEVDDLPSFAAKLLAPFVAGDVLEPQLGDLCTAALDFPIPLVDLEPGTAILELFWGPTAAFKDVGARFLAECMVRQHGADVAARKPATVLVATSGDTGGAVAAAFWRKPGMQVAVLFPEGRVSSRQRHQLTCWGDNVRAFEVRGVFDDCQRMVKTLLADTAAARAERWTSANSINAGRLLPQAVYHARAAVQYERRHGTAPGLIIPTGNLGNALAALWAMAMGFPIREVVFATNANAAVPELLRTGQFAARDTVATLANAMDVGAPSNVERLLDLLPDPEVLRRRCRALAVDDDSIKQAIIRAFKTQGQTICPHTATAFHAREQLGGDHWIVVATAHPAKFETVVEPLIGQPVAVPEALARLLDRPSRCEAMDADPEQLRRRLSGAAG